MLPIILDLGHHQIHTVLRKYISLKKLMETQYTHSHTQWSSGYVRRLVPSTCSRYSGPTRGRKQNEKGARDGAITDDRPCHPECIDNSGSVGSNIRQEVVLTGLHRCHGRSDLLIQRISGSIPTDWRCLWVEQRGCGWLWSGWPVSRPVPSPRGARRLIPTERVI